MQRKPNALHHLDGTYRSDRHDSGETGFQRSDRLKVPDWLPEVAKQHFGELVSLLDEVPGLLTDADEDALAQYCDSYADYVEASAAVDREGIILESPKGGRYMHPALAVKSSAAKRMRQIAIDFGLTPVSRSKLDLPSSNPELDEFTELFKARLAG